MRSSRAKQLKDQMEHVVFLSKTSFIYRPQAQYEAPMPNNLSLSLQSLLIAHEAHAPLRLNPRAAVSEKLVERFAVENNLIFPQFKLVNTMSAFLFPEANLKRLTIIGQLNCLLYYIDDIYGDNPFLQG